MKWFLVISCALLAVSLNARTKKISGDTAQTLYQLLPGISVFHAHPRPMNLKIGSRNLNCAQWLDQKKTATGNYRCNVPAPNNQGQIIINEQNDAVGLFNAMVSEPEAIKSRGTSMLVIRTKGAIECIKKYKYTCNTIETYCILDQ